jgi:CheY-like chemotaxis protein
MGTTAVPHEETETVHTTGGQLLLILTSRDIQSVADLALASGQSPTVTFRSLGRLVDQGFLVVGDQHGTAVYRLRPKAEPSSVSELPERILLIEDDVAISDLVVTVLEDEGYAVVVCLTPPDAMSLLDRLSFDLVITDGFSREPGAVFVNTANLVRTAGVTPVALFSAHRLDRERAQAAGFRDLITQPL